MAGGCVQNGIERLPHALVIGADRHRDGPLPDRGQEVVRIEDRGHVIGEPQAAQARHGEQGRVDLAALQLGEPGLHVAAQQRHLKIGAHHRARRQVPQALEAPADEGVAHVLPG